MEKDKKIFNISDEVSVVVYSSIKYVPDGVFMPEQVHGDKIVEVITGKESLDGCDALVTSGNNFSLGIRTADCASVCFYDGERVGIAHIGWRGLCLALIEKMLVKFDSRNLHIFVGPFLHSFEIKKDFCFNQIQEKFGNKYFNESKEKTIFLFKDAIMSLLPVGTEFDPRNTFEDISLPSFRRDQTKERLITVISFK